MEVQLLSLKAEGEETERKNHQILKLRTVPLQLLPLSSNQQTEYEHYVWKLFHAMEL